MTKPQATMTLPDGGELPYARFGLRFVGLLLDSFGIFGVAVATSLAVVGVAAFFNNLFHAHHSSSFILPIPWVGVVVACAYIVILIRRDAGTIGMRSRSTGLLCVDAKTGELPSWSQSLVRYFFLAAAGTLLVLGATGSLVTQGTLHVLLVFFAGILPFVDYVLVPLSDKKKRALHGIVAGTVVLAQPRDVRRKLQMAHSPGRKLLTRVCVLIALIGCLQAVVVSWANRSPHITTATGLAQAVSERLATTSPTATPSDKQAQAAYGYVMRNGYVTGINDFGTGPGGLHTFSITVGHDTVCLNLRTHSAHIVSCP